MFNLNKKGLSQMIGTIALVTLAIISVSLLFLSIRTHLEPSYSPEYSCLQLELNSPLSITKSCFNEQTQDTEVTIQRSKSQFLINSIEFSIDEIPISSCNSVCGSCLIQNEETLKTYYFQSPQGKTLTLSSNGCKLQSKPISIC